MPVRAGPRDEDAVEQLHAQQVADEPVEPGHVHASTRKQAPGGAQQSSGVRVPIALSVSSGLDSTVVACLAAEVRSDVPVFSVCFDGRTFDDTAGAANTARTLGLPFHPVRVSMEQLGLDHLSA